MAPKRAERVTAAFEDWAGSAAEGVWAAPGRVNLIGEHTDYNDGFVLPFAIDRRTFAAVRRRADDVVRCRSLQEGEAQERRLGELGPGTSDGWAAYPEGVVWALLQDGVALGGVDVLVDSDVPQGSGVSSSAALEAAVALALTEAHGANVDRRQLAAAGRRAEAEVVGVPTGVMDQLACLLAREAHALFLDTRSLAVEHVPLSLREHALCLLVLDTRAPRRLVEGAYAERRATCEAAASKLGVAALRDVSTDDLEAARDRLDEVEYRRARHVVTENERVLAAVDALRARGLESCGPLLLASHESLRYDYEVSSPELDVAVDGALAAGAVGARMTGAGFGGCAIALVAADRAEAVEREVSGRFAMRAWTAPGVFPVEPAGAAARVA